MKYTLFALAFAVSMSLISAAVVDQEEIAITQASTSDKAITDFDSGELKLPESQKFYGRYRILKCESIHYRPQSCHVGGTIISGYLLLRISKSPCVKYVSYSFGHTTINVSRGCRAYFVVRFH